MKVLLTALVSAAFLVGSVAGKEAGPVKSGEEAVEWMSTYTGIEIGEVESDTGETVTVVLETSPDSTIPFLLEPMAVGTLWRVTVSNVTLSLSNYHPEYLANSPKRTFEILIDSTSGRFVAGYSKVKDSASLPELPILSRQRELTADWEYAPAGSPGTTMMAALNQAPGADAPGAGQILAYYVVAKKKDGTPVRSWQVIGRGVKTPVYGAKNNVEVTTTIRCFIDDATRRPLFIETFY